MPCQGKLLLPRQARSGGNVRTKIEKAMMIKTIPISAFAALACGLSVSAAQAQNCSGPPLMFNSSMAQIEGDYTVKAGKGCRFSVSGISGVIEETVITQKPRVGTAGVQGAKAYYIAKAGYQGPDEFAYAFIGKNQYGGPMRITIKRRITVVP